MKRLWTVFRLVLGDFWYYVQAIFPGLRRASRWVERLRRAIP